MKITQLDHVALHVRDIAASRAFYRQTLQLVEIPRPAFDFPGAWFRLGTQQELHLIGGREEDVRSHHRGTHFALQVTDIDAWEQHLQSCQAVYLPRKTRPDGAIQIFVNDPDGHFIELCMPAGA